MGLSFLLHLWIRTITCPSPFVVYYTVEIYSLVCYRFLCLCMFVWICLVINIIDIIVIIVMLSCNFHGLRMTVIFFSLVLVVLYSENMSASAGPQQSHLLLKPLMETPYHLSAEHTPMFTSLFDLYYLSLIPDSHHIFPAKFAADGEEQRADS